MYTPTSVIKFKDTSVIQYRYNKYEARAIKI